MWRTEVAVEVRIPSALRAKAGGQTLVQVRARDVAEALAQLECAYPELSVVLRDADGTLRPRVNLYVNDVHIRFLSGLATSLRDGDRLYVHPIVMGG
jgi:molybdopterin converting factor small subunit